MAETIRVTVEVPELRQSLYHALKEIRAGRTPIWTVAEELGAARLGYTAIVNTGGKLTRELTALGRAVLEHYEAQR